MLKLKFVVMCQLEQMPFRLLLDILKLNFANYDWFCADGSQMISQVTNE